MQEVHIMVNVCMCTYMNDSPTRLDKSGSFRMPRAIEWEGRCQGEVSAARLREERGVSLSKRGQGEREREREIDRDGWVQGSSPTKTQKSSQT